MEKLVVHFESYGDVTISKELVQKLHDNHPYFSKLPLDETVRCAVASCTIGLPERVGLQKLIDTASRLWGVDTFEEIVQFSLHSMLSRRLPVCANCKKACILTNEKENSDYVLCGDPWYWYSTYMTTCKDYEYNDKVLNRALPEKLGVEHLKESRS